MDGRQLARGLGWFSLGLGVMEVVAPQRVSGFLGLRGRRGLVRAFGLREIASGLGILAERKPQGWLRARVAGDVMDLALLGSALRAGNPRRGDAALALAAVAGVTALDLWCSPRAGQAGGWANGAERIERSVVIDQPAETLYQFWRDLERLPQVMSHLESVNRTGPDRSHWTAKGPAGMRVEWDSQVVQDQPNRLIVWRSLEGSEVESAGWVRFEPAPGGRGTTVRVKLDYRPPGGVLGAGLAKLFGTTPEHRLAADLRRFKQLMETGEVARTEGQPAARTRSLSWKYDERSGA